ncbi:MAG TPA: hypothetical protein DD671_14890 [Balneolaceae bacterium]|nr:hypothetical protein [Balneolaceae bacterium]
MMPERCKIALFSTSFLPYSQTFIFDEIRSHSENYHVEVFCKERLNSDRFPYPHFNKPPKIFEFLYENIAYWPSFKKKIQQEKFDLVHAHFGTGAVYTLPYVKKFNLPLVVTFHGYDVSDLMGINRFTPKRWRYNLKAPSIFKHASLLLAASEELRAMLIELGAPKEKVKVYRLGIDLDRFSYEQPSPKNNPVSFVMVGRFTKKKGHIYALKALKEVLDEGFDANLSFIGSGSLEDELRQFVIENNMADKVHFKGILTADEVADELKKADVLLAPSLVPASYDRESGLIVVKEASATGRPVIGTWHGGIHEIISEGETGFLVPERNVPQLADRMIRLIKYPEMRLNFGKAGRARMEREYDLKKQVKELESHYEAVLSANS